MFRTCNDLTKPIILTQLQPNYPKQGAQKPLKLFSFPFSKSKSNNCHFLAPRQRLGLRAQTVSFLYFLFNPPKIKTLSSKPLLHFISFPLSHREMRTFTNKPLQHLHLCWCSSWYINVLCIHVGQLLFLDIR